MSSRPNVVFIMPDQLRHDFLSCYGADFLSTPHIDRIADEGTRYDKAYSLHPVCVPARASLLTGINALRTGVLGNFNYLRPDFESCGMNTWPQMLGDQGYYTAAVGKMHFYPWDAMFGLDHRVICEDKVWVNIQDDFYDYLQERGHRKYMGKEHPGYDENYGAVTSLLPWDCYWDYFVGEEAARFVREYDQERPFALMVGFPGPHDPYDPTAEWLEKIDASTIPPAAPGAPQIHGAQRNDGPPADQQRKPVTDRPVWVPEPTGPFTDAIKQKVRAHYAAQVLQIDHEVGQILAALEERGMLDNTIVIFSSDHGEMAGDHNLRGKGNFYEAYAGAMAGCCPCRSCTRRSGGTNGCDGDDAGWRGLRSAVLHGLTASTRYRTGQRIGERHTGGISAGRVDGLRRALQAVQVRQRFSGALRPRERPARAARPQPVGRTRRPLSTPRYGAVARCDALGTGGPLLQYGGRAQWTVGRQRIRPARAAASVSGAAGN